MIGTHPTKMFNARLKQPGVRASISANVPPHLICSSTVSMRQRLFAIPSNAADISKDRQALIEHPAGPGGDDLPDVMDGRIKQILVPLQGWRDDDYVTVTPLPSGGVLHEIWHRLKARDLPHWNRIIQPTPAARANHGDPLAMQYGSVRMLRRGLAKIEGGSQWRGAFACLRARVEGMNVASGLVATGWPAVTAVGGTVHALERQLGCELEFAFGLAQCQWHSLKRTTSTRRTFQNVTVFPGYTSDEMTATADMVLMIRKKGGGVPEGAEAALSGLTRLCSGSLFDVRVTVHDDAPAPAVCYALDASNDVKRGLHDGDALDCALEMYGADGEWRKNWEWFQPRNGYTINAVGYGLLEAPQQREKARGGYPHAWGEAVYGLIAQGAMTEAAWWGRSHAVWGVFWEKIKA